MFRKLLICLIAVVVMSPTQAQKSQSGQVRNALREYFSQYSVNGYQPTDPMAMTGFTLNSEKRSLTVRVNDAFSSQPFTPQSVRQIYSSLRQVLPSAFQDYSLTLIDKKGRNIRQLIPNYLRNKDFDKSRLWGKIEYDGPAWVTNISRPYVPDRGLEGRHIALWASHGRYYNGKEWEWQRPYLFCTTEDLFTQTIVVPYLIPMLERAGAVVFTPRERDWQPNEAVVDNDPGETQGSYTETPKEGEAWSDCPGTAFAATQKQWANGDNPFRQGTARQAPATSRHSHTVTATWTPRIPQAGRYAVYVSYVTTKNSIPDARYTVYHRGVATHYRVNQRMGGSTWVYLGTFDFDEGESAQNCVILTNESDHRGVVTADAVRFGGGMGNILRGGTLSGMPRFLEGARYSAQWSGMSTAIYDNRDRPTDYPDDINARSLMTNYLAGGSPYLPDREGLRVPIELSLAVHSDAGVRQPDGIYGSLAICTTNGNNDRTYLASNISREASFDFASLLLSTLTTDLSGITGQTWTRRELWDRNYSETRNPEIPSAIIETLSHQNFADMVYGHDPNFKFQLARSIYKSILRYIYFEHGKKDYAVQPLPISNFAATFTDDERQALLTWSPTPDPQTPNAQPTGYIVYTRIGDGAFDNGTLIRGTTSAAVTIKEGIQYSFRVSAVNRGGESFPSETLTVCKMPGSRRTVLIVNGFQRLSSPTVVQSQERQGFDLNDDIGIALGQTAGFSGSQLNFNPAYAGREGAGSLGFSGDELEGKIIAGNTFDYPCTHGAAIRANKRNSFVSCSRDALYKGTVDLNDYPLVDLILGAEKSTDYGLVRYKTFDARLRGLLTRYLNAGGRLLVSGTYIGSDMQSPTEQEFTRHILKYRYSGSARTDTTDYVRGLNLTMPIWRTPGPTHYAAQAPDCLSPVAPAFSAFAYGDGRPAGVAYQGTDYRVVAMGFPFECIREPALRDKAMGALLRFLLDD